MKKTNKSKITKDSIYNAALNLFSKNGFEATSIRDIAKVANVSIGLTYNYFESKDDLLKEIFQNSYEVIKDSFKIEKSDNALIEFENYLNKTFHLVQEQKKFWRLFHTLRVSENVQNILKKEYEEISTFILNNLNYHLKNLKINEKVSSYFIFAMIDGVISHFVLINEYPIEEVKTNIMNYIKSVK